MNIDKEIKKIQDEAVSGIDSGKFIKNLHRKRAQNDARTARLFNLSLIHI